MHINWTGSIEPVFFEYTEFFQTIIWNKRRKRTRRGLEQSKKGSISYAKFYGRKNEDLLEDLRSFMMSTWESIPQKNHRKA